MPIQFLPFVAFVPDGGDHGAGLSIAQNALPVHGSWRPPRQLAVLSSKTEGPVNGAYVHVYQQSAAVQYLRPDGDIVTTSWESTVATFYGAIDETSPDDADYFYAPGAPAAVALTVSLSNPGSTSGADHILRWRYRIPVTPSSAWTAKLELLETATVIATDTATGSAATAWVQREYSLSAGEIAAISNRNNLRFRFTATAPGSAQAARPTSDVATGSWLTQAGGSSSLYATIDESSPSDADYIESPTLVLGGAAATYTAGLGSTVVDPVTHAGWQWKYRLWARNAGVQVVARLKQGSTTIATTTHSNVSTSAATVTNSLSTAEAALVTDFASLRLEWEASYPTSTASTASQSARPSSDVSAGGWSPSSGGTLYTMVDEAVADDGDLIYATTEAPCTLGLSTVLLAQASDTHTWVIRARRATATAIVVAELLEASTVIRTESLSLTSASFANFSFTLTASERAAITDGSALRVRLTFDKEGSGAGAQPQVSQIYVTVPEPRRGRVSYAELTAPSASRVEISWSEMQVPDATTQYRGDVPTVFAGTQTRLYAVTQAGFSDVSKAAYSSGALPGGWNFCSIGNQVIATNRVDPVQLRIDNAGNFEDCITTGSPPKARFCCAFREQLLLGDINLTGHDPDEVWASQVNNVRDFDATTGTSFYLPIRSRPGQITGLVGGDFAVIFKRRSIHGLDWIGGATLSRVRDISGSVGAPLGRSIVEAEGQIYFWDGLCFRRTNGYDAPERIGSESISRYLTDASFSGPAFAAVEPATIGAEDAMISGWYDTASGLIFWAYQAADDELVGAQSPRHRRAVVYNPSEDRWSTLLLDSQSLTVGTPNPAISTVDPYLSRGSNVFTWDGTTASWAKFSGGETMEMTLRTKRQTIALDEFDRPAAIRVTGVQPVLTFKPDAGALPDYEVTVRAAEDPHFLLNLQQETYPRSKANEAGWFPHSITGAWFEIEVSIPEITGTTLAVKGVNLRYEAPRGRV